MRRLVAIIMAVAGGWAPDMGWAETSQLLLHKTLRPDETGFVEGIRNAQLDSEETRQQKKKFNDDQNYNNSGQGVYEDFQQSVTKKWTQKFGKCQTAPFDRRPHNAVLVTRDPNSGVISYQEEVSATDLLKIHQPVGASPSPASMMTLRITFPGKVKLGTEGQILPDGFTVEWVKSYENARMGPWKLEASYQLPRPGELDPGLVEKWNNRMAQYAASGTGKPPQPGGPSRGQKGIVFVQPKMSQSVKTAFERELEKFNVPEDQKAGLLNDLENQKIQENQEWLSEEDGNTFPSLGLRRNEIIPSTNLSMKGWTSGENLKMWYRVDVIAGSPAQYAQLKPGSVIVGAQYKNGEEWVSLDVEDPINYVRLADERFSQDVPVRFYLLNEEVGKEFIPPQKLGIQIGSKDLISVRLSDGTTTSGVLVSSLVDVMGQKSLARAQGIKMGDVICSVQEELSNDWRILPSREEFVQTIRRHALSKTPLRLSIARDVSGGRQIFGLVKLTIHWGTEQRLKR